MAIPMTPLMLCECKCGQPVQPGRRFINGHNSRVREYTDAARLKNSHPKHGMRGSPEYGAFKNAKQRSTNPKFPQWNDYGGRGIKFLFTSFEQFYAELGPKPSPKHSLDRFPNNDGNYEPGNVRWATKKEQQLNRRCSQKAA